MQWWTALELNLSTLPWKRHPAFPLVQCSRHGVRTVWPDTSQCTLEFPSWTLTCSPSSRTSDGITHSEYPKRTREQDFWKVTAQYSRLALMLCKGSWSTISNAFLHKSMWAWIHAVAPGAFPAPEANSPHLNTCWAKERCLFHSESNNCQTQFAYSKGHVLWNPHVNMAPSRSGKSTYV